MCEKKQFKYCPSTIDKCMQEVITNLNFMLKDKFKIVSCCCGHGIYPMTIVVENGDFNIVEIFSGKEIPRKKKFYKKDKKGYYYIPEVSEAKDD